MVDEGPLDCVVEDFVGGLQAQGVAQFSAPLLRREAGRGLQLVRPNSLNIQVLRLRRQKAAKRFVVLTFPAKVARKTHDCTRVLPPVCGLSSQLCVETVGAHGLAAIAASNGVDFCLQTYAADLLRENLEVVFGQQKVGQALDVLSSFWIPTEAVEESYVSLDLFDPIEQRACAEIRIARVEWAVVANSRSTNDRSLRRFEGVFPQLLLEFVVGVLYERRPVDAIEGVNLRHRAVRLAVGEEVEFPDRHPFGTRVVVATAASEHKAFDVGQGFFQNAVAMASTKAIHFLQDVVGNLRHVCARLLQRDRGEAWKLFDHIGQSVALRLCRLRVSLPFGSASVPDAKVGVLRQHAPALRDVRAKTFRIAPEDLAGVFSSAFRHRGEEEQAGGKR